jgi:hypothetical protein
LAQVQATFALIRKHKQYPAAAVQAWQQGQADIAVSDPVSGTTRSLQRYLPGTILDVPEQTEYEFPSARVPADSLVAVLQAELRAAAARLVLPEYMLTSDASNANYASTLVAEAPAVKHFERLQRQLARKFGDGRYGGAGRCGALWRVLECAAEWGRLPRAVLKRVSLHVEPPSPVARDKDKETARAGALNKAGVLSKATWAKWEGLDHRRERRQIRQEKQQDQPPGGRGGFREEGQRLVEVCQPHKSGRYVGTKIGYDPERSNGNCHLGVGNRAAASGNALSGVSAGTSGSSRKGGSEPGSGGTDSGRKGNSQSREYKGEKRARVFKEVYGQVIGSGEYRDPAKAAELVREIVSDGRKARIPQADITEAAMAVLLGHKLQSAGKHGYDTVGQPGLWRDDEATVRVDVKTSKVTGYSDKYDTKVHKILEYLKERGLPGYLVLVRGKGVYLHVGIDPASKPKFQVQEGGRSLRGLVEPGKLNDAIKGDGSAIPVVKVASWTSLESLGKAAEAEINEFRGRVRGSLEGIDMAKLRRHVNKQIKQAVDGNADDLLKIAPDVVIGKVVKKARKKALKALAAEAPIETVKAGLAAMTPEEREALLRELNGK